MQRPYNSLRLPDRKKPNLLRQITAAPNNINRDEELERQVYGSLLNKREDFSNPMKIIESAQRGAEEGGLSGGIGGAVQGIGQFAASPMGKRLIAIGISKNNPELARYIAGMADEDDQRNYQQEEIRKQRSQRMYEFKTRGRQEALGQAQAQRGLELKEEKEQEKYIVKEENTMRKEYDALNKDFRIISDSWAKVKEVTRNPSPASDIALIFSFMHILEKMGIVRESEQAMLRASGSLSDRAKGYIEKLKTGKFLAPNIRLDFITQSRLMYEALKKETGKRQKQYVSLAKRRGLNPMNVVLPIEESDEPNKPRFKQIVDVEQY